MAEQEMWIVTATTNAVDTIGSKGVEGYAHGSAYDQPEHKSPDHCNRTKVNTIKLKQQMREFVAGVEDLFAEAEAKNDQIQLDEIELTVEVNAEGEVSLWGLGGTSVGGSAAVTLKFSRKDG